MKLKKGSAKLHFYIYSHIGTYWVLSVIIKKLRPNSDFDLLPRHPGNEDTELDL